MFVSRARVPSSSSGVCSVASGVDRFSWISASYRSSTFFSRGSGVTVWSTSMTDGVSVNCPWSSVMSSRNIDPMLPSGAITYLPSTSVRTESYSAISSVKTASTCGTCASSARLESKGC